MASALLLGPGPWDAGEQAALERRLALAGVAVRAVAPADDGRWRPRLLLAALAGAEAARSWLVCRDGAALPAAASAGLAGMVLVGCDPPPGDGLLVLARAESLADAPRVMVPRAGGCWHDHGG